MFTVEWLKDGNPVYREAMIGSSAEDVLRVARTLSETAKQASGTDPDTLRVTDHMTSQTTFEAIAHA